MKASFVFGVIVVASLLTDHGWSPDAKPPPKPTLPKGRPAEQIKELIAQHDKAAAAFRKLYEAAKTEAEQEKLFALYPEPQPYADLLFQIAEKNPKEPAAVDALIWIYRKSRSPKAKVILIRDHLLNPKIAGICRVLRHEHDQDTLTALKKIFAENPNKNAQSQAAVALGMRLRSDAGFARQMQKAGAKVSELEKNFGKELVANLMKADPVALEKEAEALFERVTKDKAYAETVISFGEDDRITAGKLAGRELFEMRYLQPGKAAPEIVGEDIDGKLMKLSDFRGKVVLLDFWAFW